MRNFCNFVKENITDFGFDGKTKCVYIRDLFDEFKGDKDKIADYLNSLLKDKRIKLQEIDDGGEWEPSYHDIWYSVDEVLNKKYPSNYHIIIKTFDTQNILRIRSDDRILFQEYKRIITKEDPYGEEDWMSESLESRDGKHFKIDRRGNFKIGDRVYCIGKYRDINFNKETGEVKEFYVTSDADEIFIRFDSKFDTHLESGDYNQDPQRQSYYVGYNNVKHLDENKLKELFKRKEENSLRHIDIDPYGEDDWWNE